MPKTLRIRMSQDDLVGQTIGGRFVVQRRLGGGSFGAVFEAEDNVTHEVCALKFETKNASRSQLKIEYECYCSLVNSISVPSVFGLFSQNHSQILAMEKMGPSLEKLFRKCTKIFSLKTVLMIADQLLRGIEYIHNSGLIHRDIKPQNFVIGRGKNSKNIYFIDFGVSMRYISSHTGNHVLYSGNNGLVGTAPYVSINTHLGDQQSRRDDLESIMYVLIRFLKGSLPWQKLNIKNPEQRLEKITQMKIQTSTQILCQGIPIEFRHALEYIRSLRFDQTPNYHSIRKRFTKLFLKMGYVNDGIFDWDMEAPIHRPLPKVFLYHTANRFLRENERQIRPKQKLVEIPPPRNMFLDFWRNHK